MSSEIQSILNAFEQSQHQGKSTFLATVVGTQGSTYRRPSARLLIAEDGQTVGLVSGGYGMEQVSDEQYEGRS